jgi:cellulose synthase/poly-beta-1,6-N-acetylglucosamine synthase-like glycosyltransferase
MAAPSKIFLLPLVPPFVLGLVGWFEVWPWLLNRTHPDIAWTALTIASAIIWVLVLWWAIHHLTYQLVGLVPWRKPSEFPEPKSPPRIVVLYMTRDDFMPECCASCLAQSYPSESFRMVVCDDSESDSYRESVAKFCSERGVKLLRREDRSGHKAGNLNHAMAAEAIGQCDWVVVLDADQWIKPNYLAELAPALAIQPNEVAYVQAGREPLSDSIPAGSEDNLFQNVMQTEILVFNQRDMAARPRFGFLPFLGHGGAIRPEAWQKVGGFPPVVSEDFAFSMSVRQHEKWGERVDHVRSQEGTPPDFRAFMIRLSKFAAGAGELWFRRLPRFLTGGFRFTENPDALMLLGGYALMPFFLINLLISAYLCHGLWTEAVSIVPPRLPYLFLGMFLLSWAVVISVTPNPIQAIRYWFWAIAVYGACMPVAACRFIAALFVRPAFHRTPKVARGLPRRAIVPFLVIAWGLVGLAIAWHWWSPFSPILIASASAQVCSPFYYWLHEKGTTRRLIGQALVYLPGMSFLVGLVWMWLWATS